nr:hypothetical protein [Rhodoluna lacicola]
MVQITKVALANLCHRLTSKNPLAASKIRADRLKFRQVATIVQQG